MLQQLESDTSRRRVDRGERNPSNTMKRPMIILIDDDQAWVQDVRLLLTEEGFQVEAASDGAEGLDLLDRCSPSLVILDVHLPKVSGFELLNELRRRSRDLPVLMVSADDQASLMVEALSRGASSFLRKPVSHELLLKALHRFVHT